MQRRCLGLAGSSGAESGKILYDFVIRARGASKLAGNPIGSGITLNSIIISAAASKRQPAQASQEAATDNQLKYYGEDGEKLQICL